MNVFAASLLSVISVSPKLAVLCSSLDTKHTSPFCRFTPFLCPSIYTQPQSIHFWSIYTRSQGQTSNSVTLNKKSLLRNPQHPPYLESRPLPLALGSFSVKLQAKFLDHISPFHRLPLKYLFLILSSSCPIFPLWLPECHPNILLSMQQDPRLFKELYTPVIAASPEIISRHFIWAVLVTYPRLM